MCVCGSTMSHLSQIFSRPPPVFLFCFVLFFGLLLLCFCFCFVFCCCCCVFVLFSGLLLLCFCFVLFVVVVVVFLFCFVFCCCCCVFVFVLFFVVVDISLSLFCYLLHHHNAGLFSLLKCNNILAIEKQTKTNKQCKQTTTRIYNNSTENRIK